ncbi:MAG: hypothetical protein RR630_05280 [Coprobacillus sp.]
MDIQTTIYVYLPYIEELAKNKVLGEWEALIYLIHNGDLDNIEYERGEMIEMLEEKYEEFNQDEQLVKETSLRYYTEMDLNEWHDYDVKVAKEQGRIETMMYLIKEKYNENAIWLNECTSKQLDEVMFLYVCNKDYQVLQSVLN